MPTDFSKSCDAKCSAEHTEDATSGCEVCPDARNALSCGGGAVEEDATTDCEVCPDARNALSCGGGAVEKDATSGCEM